VTAALLSCSDARIDADGAVLLDALSFEADGARVGLLGGFSPLFRLFSRTAVLLRGSVQVLGSDAERAVAWNQLGLAPAEPTLPEPWTVSEFLTASAGLMGLLRRSAARAAGVALESLEITGLAKRKIGTLGAVERRVVLFAHAILGRPSVIFADRPLAHLPDEAAGEVRAALERAAHGRRLIASVEAPAGAGHELNLLSSMDRVAVMEASTLVMVGPPAMQRPWPARWPIEGSAWSGTNRALKRDAWWCICRTGARPCRSWKPRSRSTRRSSSWFQ